MMKKVALAAARTQQKCAALNAVKSTVKPTNPSKQPYIRVCLRGARRQSNNGPFTPLSIYTPLYIIQTLYIPPCISKSMSGSQRRVYKHPRPLYTKLTHTFICFETMLNIEEKYETKSKNSTSKRYAFTFESYAKKKFRENGGRINVLRIRRRRRPTF